MAGVGAYPGSFNPLTVAHLAIVDVALRQHDLTRVDLVFSRRPLGKLDARDLADLDERIAAAERALFGRADVAVVVTEAQLLADIAEGYDVLVLGADKWAQLHDVTFYADESARDAALARLPRLAIAPRPPHDAPDEHRLHLPDWVAEVSATAVRGGRHDWRA